MQHDNTNERRGFLKSAAGTGLAALSGLASAQAFEFKPNQRYPDPSVQILDPSFAKYRIYSSTIEQVATGMRWAEGPAYFPEGGYLLFSDIPNNRIMKYSEKDGSVSIFRNPSNDPAPTCLGEMRAAGQNSPQFARVTVKADRCRGYVEQMETVSSPVNSFALTSQGSSLRKKLNARY